MHGVVSISMHAHFSTMADDTSIRIKVKTWRRLKDRKAHPNESFDDVINDLLDEAERTEEGNATPPLTTAN